MTWADEHGVSYLAWGWWVLSTQEKSDAGCSAFYLISDPSGTPAAPNGVALHDHLVALAAGGGPTSTPTPGTGTCTGTGTGTGSGGTHPSAPGLRHFSARVTARGTAVRISLRSNQNSSGVLSGQTVGSFATTAATPHRRRVSVGSVRFKLAAGTSKTVVLMLSRTSRTLLSRRHTLKVQFTIALTNPARRRAVSHRTLTWKAPARHRR